MYLFLLILKVMLFIGHLSCAKPLSYGERLWSLGMIASASDRRGSAAGSCVLLRITLVALFHPDIFAKQASTSASHWELLPVDVAPIPIDF